jgi:hypothetical protein
VDRDTTGEYVNSTQPATATSSSSSEWNGGTSSFTFSGTTITSNTGNVAIRTNDTFAGDCKLEHTVTTANDKMVFGFYEISEDGTFSASAGRGGMDSMTKSWFWRSEGTDAIYYGGANQASQAISDGSTVKIERLSGVWKLYVGGSVVHTWSQQSTNTVRIVFSVDGPSASSVYSNVSWTDIANTTINATGTLISDPQTASSSRTSASGVIIYEDAAGTNTLGTDLEVYFTANNGTNWTEAASYGTATTYSGTKKLVKLGATTVTAGTQVAMKAVWANQSVGTSGTQALIAQGTGTIIGDFTTNVSNAFDSTSSTRANSAQHQNSQTLSNVYIGKDLGSGNAKIITGASWESPSDADSLDSAATLTVKLYASNSAPTSYSDGTLLGTIGTEANGTTGQVTSNLTFSNSTEYRYVWIYASSSGTNNNFYCAEVKFYETPLIGIKEARLHGWAVNY